MIKNIEYSINYGPTFHLAGFPDAQAPQRTIEENVRMKILDYKVNEACLIILYGCCALQDHCPL